VTIAVSPEAQGAQVLLVGPEAQALATRLEASGYRPLLPGDPSEPEHPAVVLLSPGWEAEIPDQRHRWGSLPILLGIHDDDVAGRSRCLASGADDFWLTSLGPSDLLTRLRLHLRSRGPSQEPMPLLQLADLKVNTETRQVLRGKRPVPLTAREYQLLLLLLDHRDQPVSRETILGEIWDDQRTAASNVIEVYVRYLRQKLEAGGERRLIHTVRGCGYCLSDRPSSLP